MSFNTPYGRRVLELNNDFILKFLKHSEENNMAPFVSNIDDKHNQLGGYGNRAPVGEWSYQELTNEAEPRPKARGKGKEQKNQKPKPKPKAKAKPSMKRPPSLIISDRDIDDEEQTVPPPPKSQQSQQPKSLPQPPPQPQPPVLRGEGAFMTSREKLERIIREGGVKPKQTAKGKKIDDIIKSVIGNGEGVAVLKKGNGKLDRKIGGRQLLLKEQQPVSRMSGLGKKTNKWLEHLAEFRKTHPNLKGKELMVEAKKTYK